MLASCWQCTSLRNMLACALGAIRIQCWGCLSASSQAYQHCQIEAVVVKYWLPWESQRGRKYMKNIVLFNNYWTIFRPRNTIRKRK